MFHVLKDLYLRRYLRKFILSSEASEMSSTRNRFTIVLRSLQKAWTNVLRRRSVLPLTADAERYRGLTSSVYFGIVMVDILLFMEHVGSTEGCMIMEPRYDVLSGEKKYPTHQLRWTYISKRYIYGLYHKYA